MCVYVAVGRGNFSVISCKSSRVSKVILSVQYKTTFYLATINIFIYNTDVYLNLSFFNFIFSIFCHVKIF